MHRLHQVDPLGQERRRHRPHKNRRPPASPIRLNPHRTSRRKRAVAAEDEAVGALRLAAVRQPRLRPHKLHQLRKPHKLKPHKPKPHKWGVVSGFKP